MTREAHNFGQRDQVRASLHVLGNPTERRNSYALTALKPCVRCGEPRSLLFCRACAAEGRS